MGKTILLYLSMSLALIPNNLSGGDWESAETFGAGGPEENPEKLLNKTSQSRNVCVELLTMKKSF